MKLLLVFISFFLSLSLSARNSLDIRDSLGIYVDYSFQNYYNIDIYFPEELTTDSIKYNFSDSLFIGYETLKNLNPSNKLSGNLYDFFYYNFEVISARYGTKYAFDNLPFDQVVWDSIQQENNREPCDPVVFQISDDLFTKWYPCYQGPFWIKHGFYNNYEEYMEKQKPYIEIYNLGNIKVREGMDSKLILVDENYNISDFKDANFEREYRRQVFLFTSIKNRIRSIILISEYKEFITTYDKEIHPDYTNIQLKENGNFIQKFDYPEDYRQQDFDILSPEYSEFFINDEGFIDFPEND